LAALGGIVAMLSYLMGIVPMLAFGLASFLIGIMIIYLPESGTIPASVASDSSLPSLLNIEKLLEDLDLDERGIYIPTSGLGVSPKVFVPLAQTPTTKRPSLGLAQSRRIFVTVGKNPEDRGVLLDAPGSQILSSLERTLRVDFANEGSENLENRLDSGFRALGIGNVPHLELEESSVRIEIGLISLVELEMKLRELAPRLVAQIGTPTASAAAAAVSKATRRYVTFKSEVLDLADRRIDIDLKLSE